MSYVMRNKETKILDEFHALPKKIFFFFFQYQFTTLAKNSRDAWKSFLANIG